MDSNCVKVEIRKKYIVDYLHYTFQSNIEKPIKINLQHPIGKFIYAMTFNLPYQLPRRKKDSDILFELPASHYNTKLDSHYIHIYRWGEEKINFYLESWFKLEFERHMIISERMGIEYRRAVENFMWGRKIELAHIDKGSLIKSNYRFRNSIIKEILDVEQQKEYQIFREEQKKVSAKSLFYRTDKHLHNKNNNIK